MTKNLISISKATTLSKATIVFLVLLTTSLFSQAAYSTDPYAAKRHQITQQNATRKVQRKQKLLAQQRQKYHQAQLLQQRKNQQRRQQQRKQTQYSAAPHNTNASNQQRRRQQNATRNAQQQQRLAQQKRQRLQRTHQQRKQKQGNFRNVWDRVYHGFRFRDYNNNPLVRRYTRDFSRSPARVQRLADRSSDYLYMVVNELNRRGMPTELALLPFVESAYRNVAYSHAGAAGMWQFIPATGRTYGLHQTRSYDARLDSHQATRAALSYLQKLNRQFKGDWLLSLAAYNAGEYRVQREIDKNRRLGKRTDYWSLNLPRETRQYVPRLLAYKEIFRNPRKYGVHLRGIPNNPALASIQVNKPVNLRKAAAHAGLPASRLLSLNSGFLHGITIPRYSNQILLPRRHAGRLNKIIQSLPPAADVHRKTARRYSKTRKSRYVYHKVRLGDNLYRIARKHGTTVKKIKRLNKLRNNKIWPGKRLKIARGRSKTRRS